MKQLSLFKDELEPHKYMKALSIQEPWLTLIVDGKKTIETRTWPTNYRGHLLLAGSKKPVGNYAGLAACIVDLVDCREMTIDDEEAACCAIYPNAHSWVLENVRRVNPVPITGRLGLYNAKTTNLRVINKEGQWVQV